MWHEFFMGPLTCRFYVGFSRLLATGIILLWGTLGNTQWVRAQESAADSDSNERLTRRARVYLDCDCYNTYLRRHLTFVTYVRDRTQADVHLLATTRSAGGGGTSYRLEFIGRGPFQGLRFERTYNAPPTLSDDEQRRGLANKIRLGLIPFASLTPAADRLSISYEAPSDTTSEVNTSDPWNHWVFEVGGSGSLDLEELERQYEIQGDLEAERVTEAWKIDFDFDSDYDLDVFEQDGKEIRSVSRYTSLDTYVVKSLGPHWGAGLFGRSFVDTFTNTDLGARVEPAVEYNFFPYSVSDQKELTFTYRVGPEYRNYDEPTIFGKKDQLSVQHSLRIGLDLQRSWGSFHSSVEGAHYFHNLSRNRVNFSTGLSLHLIRGLSLNGSFDIRYIQDQLYLPAGDASLDEVLLRRQALATNYEIDASLGLSYTFGSIYNSVVNTRL